MKYKFIISLSILFTLGFMFSHKANAQSTDCDFPTTIGVGAANCQTGNTSAATEVTLSNAGTCYDGFLAMCVFYSYTATGTENTVTVTPSTAENIVIFMKTACATFIDHVCGTGTNVTSITSNIAIGTTVIVEICSTRPNPGAPATDGSFDVCVESISPPPTPGNECTNASQICDLTATFSETTGPSGGTAFTPGCFGLPTTNMIWYEFTVTATGDLNWSMTPNSGTSEFDWAFYDISNGCVGSGNELELVCNYNYAGATGAAVGMAPGGTGEFSPTYTFVAGDVGKTFAIMIDDYTGDNLGYTANFAGSTFSTTPTAGFTTSPTSPITECSDALPLSVSFTNTTTGAVSYSWDFGNGNTSTAMTPPTQSYTAVGSYTVALVATSASGCTDVHSETIVINQLPVADFTLPVTTACTTDGTITPNTTGQTTGGTWSATAAGLTIDAGTGVITPSSSTAGTYTVTYNITNNGCSDTHNASITINMTPVAPTNATVNNTCADPNSGVIAANGTGLLWYTDAGLTMPAGGSTTAPAYDPVNPITAYVTQTVNGCTSTALMIVTAPATNCSGCEAGEPTLSSTSNIVCCGETATYVNTMADYDPTLADFDPNQDYELGYVFVTAGSTAPATQADIDAALYITPANADDGTDNGMSYASTCTGLTATTPLPAGAYDIYPFLSVQEFIEDRNFTFAGTGPDNSGLGGSESYYEELLEYPYLDNGSIATPPTLIVNINSVTDNYTGGGNSLDVIWVDVFINNVYINSANNGGGLGGSVDVSSILAGAGYNADDNLFIQINFGFTDSGGGTPMIGTHFTIDYTLVFDFQYNETLPTLASGAACQSVGTPTTLYVVDEIDFTATAYCESPTENRVVISGITGGAAALTGNPLSATYVLPSAYTWTEVDCADNCTPMAGTGCWMAIVPLADFTAGTLGGLTVENSVNGQVDACPSLAKSVTAVTISEPNPVTDVEICEAGATNMTATCAACPDASTATVNWYSSMTATTPEGTGASFDPTGTTAEEGAYDANTPGTYTYYTECACVGCDECASTRVAVTTTVYSTPVLAIVGTPACEQNCVGSYEATISVDLGTNPPPGGFDVGVNDGTPSTTTISANGNITVSDVTIGTDLVLTLSPSTFVPDGTSTCDENITVTDPDCPVCPTVENVSDEVEDQCATVVSTPNFPPDATIIANLTGPNGNTNLVSGLTIDWGTPTIIVAGDACTAQVAEYSLDVICPEGSGACNLTDIATYTVTTYPEITATVSQPDLPLECRVAVTPSCATFDVSYDANDQAGGNATGTLTDDGSGNFVFDPDAVFPPAGSVGDVSFTVSNPNAPGTIDATCMALVTAPQAYKCCIAEAGFIQAPVICPDDNLVINIKQYEDFELYSEFLIITDDSGMITDMIDLSDAADMAAQSVSALTATGASLTNDIGNLVGQNDVALTIPYSFWGLVAGDMGLDINTYTYNVFDVNQPVPTPTIGMNISSIGNTSSGCYDLSPPNSMFIPAPFSVINDPNVNEGEGGVSPFHYNDHQITITGGHGPYNYQWETEGYVRHAVTGEGMLNIIYADDAVWHVTVTDANGCTRAELIFTNNPAGEGLEGEILDIYDYVITPELSNQANGSVDIFVEGGTQPYTYVWSGPNGYSATTEDIFGLVSGWYSVTVYDSGNPQQNTIGWYWVPRIDGNHNDSGIRGKASLADIQASPNPFSEKTDIAFSIVESGTLSIDLFTINGQKVQNLFNGEADAGQTYHTTLNADQLPAGVYIVRLLSNNGIVQTEKLMLSK